MKYKIVLLTGTRPDIIKIWPVYKELLNYSNLEIIVIKSGQHDQLANQAFDTFEFSPNFTVNIPESDKLQLGYLHSSLVHKLTKNFIELNPDMVLVHGDTTTAFAGAVAAFLRNIPIGHIEAGLRTSRFEYPFPEEGYRRAISRFTTLHFAPTQKSADNLKEENIHNNIYITGNTIVDSLTHMINMNNTRYSGFKPSILITCHRRESYGEPLKLLCENLIKLSEKYSIVWPVHPNPVIRDTIVPILKDIKNIHLISPEDYQTFVARLVSSLLVITDSGGVMEECAVLNIPTIVLRTETERPEILNVDNIHLVGYNFEKLVSLTDKILSKSITQYKENNTIFGDGTAGKQIANIIYNYFKGKN